MPQALERKVHADGLHLPSQPPGIGSTDTVSDGASSRFIRYRDKYDSIRFERSRGILIAHLHTDGGPLRWGATPHRELPAAFRDIADDPENRAVVITGTGDEFSGPVADPEKRPRWTAREWVDIQREGVMLLRNLLDIPVPVIAAVNGPAVRHAEIPLLADIVLASPEASFADSAHCPAGLVPGDGAQLIYPLLMGWNRGRYFLLTGQTIGAEEALAIGLVAEIVPRDTLLDRAEQLAAQLVAQDPITMRYTRAVLTAPIKALLDRWLEPGLSLEGIAAMANTAPPDDEGAP